MKLNPKIVTFLSILLGLACQSKAEDDEPFLIEMDSVSDDSYEGRSCEITERGEGEATCTCYLKVGEDVDKLIYKGVYKEGCEDLSDVDLIDDDESPENEEGKFAFKIIFTPGSGESQSNIVKYSEERGNYFEACVKVEAMGLMDGKEEMVNYAFIDVSADVNDDGDYDISSIVAKGARFSGESFEERVSDSGEGSVTGEQCGNPNPKMGQKVCVDLLLNKEEAVGEMDHIEEAVFYKGPKNKKNDWDALGADWTEADTKVGSCKASSCKLRTTLPSFMYMGEDEVWVEGLIKLRAPSSRRRDNTIRGDRRLSTDEEHFSMKINFQPIDDDSAAASTSFKFLITSFFFGMAVHFL